MNKFYDYKKWDLVVPRPGRKSSNDLNFADMEIIRTDEDFPKENGNTPIRVSYYSVKGKFRYRDTIFAGAIMPASELKRKNNNNEGNFKIFW